MVHRLTALAAIAVLSVTTAGCGETDNTIVTSTHEVNGALGDCCSLSGDRWSLQLVGDSKSQALLMFDGAEKGLMELRDGKFDAISDRPDFERVTIADRPGAIQKPKDGTSTLLALVGDVNEHDEHLVIQIPCDTPECAEFDSLIGELSVENNGT